MNDARNQPPPVPQPAPTLTTRERATLILEKGADHEVQRVRLRRL